jgi:hypothetical protein
MNETEKSYGANYIENTGRQAEIFSASVLYSHHSKLSDMMISFF